MARETIRERAPREPTHAFIAVALEPLATRWRKAPR
jgi:hypothetical protein